MIKSEGPSEGRENKITKTPKRQGIITKIGRQKGQIQVKISF
jgi:hypothetical protein